MKFIHIIIFVIILFIQPNYADNCWHIKFNKKVSLSTLTNRDLESNIDYNIKKLHSNCNCTGEYFNKSLVELRFQGTQNNEVVISRLQNLKLNTKFVKLFNKFLK
jgi:hypothetical protein